MGKKEAPEFERVDIDSLKPFDGNPRKISEKGLEKLKKSVESFGFTNPVLAQRSTRMIIAGHQRVKAAKAAGLEKVPVIWLDFDDKTAKAYNIADNRLSQEAEWDMDQLALLIQELEEQGQDLLATGFDEVEIDDFIHWPDPDDVVEDDFDVEEAIEEIKEPITKPGDIWILGEHRLMCGDCTDKEALLKLFDGEMANVAITSPPYAEQRKEDYHSIPADEYPKWFLKVAANVYANLDDAGSFFVNIKEHVEDGQRSLYVYKTIIELVENGWRYVDQLIWERRIGLPGGWPNRLRNTFEPVHFFTKHESINWMVQLVDVDIEQLEQNPNLDLFDGYEDIFHFSKSRKIKFKPKAVGRRSDQIRVPHKDNLQRSKTGNVGVTGKVRSGIARASNVINLPVNMESVDHPAAFPVRLPGFFIKLTTDKNEVVYEPFSGSGTTIIAAEQLKRRCLAMELEPLYCDVAVKRWEEYTGLQAKRLGGE